MSYEDSGLNPDGSHPSETRSVYYNPDRDRSVTRSAYDELGAASAIVRRKAGNGERVTTSEAKRIRAAAARVEQIAKRNARPRPTVVRTAHVPVLAIEDPTNDELRSGALLAVERSRYLSPAAADRMDAMIRGKVDGVHPTGFARHVCATGTDAYRSAFFKTMRGSNAYDMRERLAIESYHAKVIEETRAMSESGSAGLALPVTIDPTVIEAGAELPTLGQLVHTVVSLGPVWKGVVHSSVASFSWPGEGNPPSADVLSSGSFEQPVIDLYQAEAWVPYSRELADDYPGWQEEISSMLTRGYGDLVQDVVTTGDGSSKPTGLFNGLVTDGTRSVSVTTAGTIGVTDVRKAWGNLPERAKGDATWVMSETVLRQIRNLDGAASQLDIVSDRQGVTIMSRPVVVTSYAPGFTGTSGTTQYLVVGSLDQGYTLATRLGLVVDPVTTVRATASGRPTGQRGYLGLVRLGGGVTNSAVLSMLTN